MEAYCLQALMTGLLSNPDNSYYRLTQNNIIVNEEHTYLLSDKYNLTLCETPQRFANVGDNFKKIAFIGQEEQN